MDAKQKKRRGGKHMKDITTIVWTLIILLIVIAMGLYAFDSMKVDSVENSTFYNISAEGESFFSVFSDISIVLVYIVIAVLFFWILAFLLKKSSGGAY